MELLLWLNIAIFLIVCLSVYKSNKLYILVYLILRSFTTLYLLPSKLCIYLFESLKKIKRYKHFRLNLLEVRSFNYYL